MLSFNNIRLYSFSTYCEKSVFEISLLKTYRLSLYLLILLLFNLSKISSSAFKNHLACLLKPHSCGTGRQTNPQAVLELTLQTSGANSALRGEFSREVAREINLTRGNLENKGAFSNRFPLRSTNNVTTSTFEGNIFHDRQQRGHRARVRFIFGLLYSSVSPWRALRTGL